MLLDILVLVIFALVTVYYAKKGLIRSIAGFIGLIVSILAASLLCSKVALLIHPYVEEAVDNIHITDSLINQLAGKLLGSEAVSCAIAFGLIFVVGLLLCKLAMILLSVIFELPILSGANHLAGGILGAMIGFLYAEILSLVLFCFSEYLIGTVDWLTADVYSGSIVAKWLFEHNLFQYVFDFAL
jgi:uncharacterized membrane protein required for colicin V production